FKLCGRRPCFDIAESEIGNIRLDRIGEGLPLRNCQTGRWAVGCEPLRLPMSADTIAEIRMRLRITKERLHGLNGELEAAGTQSRPGRAEAGHQGHQGDRERLLAESLQPVRK